MLCSFPDQTHKCHCPRVGIRAPLCTACIHAFAFVCVRAWMRIFILICESFFVKNNLYVFTLTGFSDMANLASFISKLTVDFQGKESFLLLI